MSLSLEAPQPKNRPNAAAPIERKPLLEFTDFRAFLRAHIEQRKLANPAWSFGIWARQLGLKSPSTLIMVVNGQRSPGPKLIDKICAQLGLDKSESAHFRDLVRLQKVQQDVRLSLEVIKQIQSRTPEKGFRKIDEKTFAAVATPHHYAIREMVNLEGFVESAQWISRRLRYPIPAFEVERAIQDLLAAGLLERDARGALKQGQPHFDSPTDVLSEALKAFHDQMLEMARAAQHSGQYREREVSGGTFAIRKENLEKAKKLIRSFQTQLCELVESTSGDEVYQLEVAFFPLTEKKEPK